MNNRERLTAILAHESPDRIPWIPRLLLWYNAKKRRGTLPDRWKDSTLREIEHDLRLGTPARDGRIFQVRQEGVEVVHRCEGDDRITEWHTPVGSVRQVERTSADLERDQLPGRIMEYPLKGPADYKVWAWITENTTWDADYAAYEAYDAEIGEDGLPMVAVGENPFHDFVQNLAGYETAFYQLADHQREIDQLMGLMEEVQRERLWPIIAESPARLVLHGVHLTNQFTPPKLFEKYIIPYYDGMMPLIHDKGISVTMHADNDVSRLLSQLERAGYDMMECLVTAPMVPLTLAEAREAWGDRVIIWGGLPSLLLSPSVPEQELHDYMEYLFKTIAPGDAFILGVSDNVMPDSLIERVAWVSDLMDERGAYPVNQAVVDTDAFDA